MSKKTCLIICRLGDEGSSERHRADELVLVVNDALKGQDFDVLRSDDIALPGDIMTDLKDRLRMAHIVIADLTELNANVMFEVGFRHAWGGPCIHIAQKSTELPHDVRGHRTIPYDFSTTPGKRQAVQDIRKYIAAAFAQQQEIPAAPPLVELWDRIRGVLEPDRPEASYGDALDQVVELIRSATRGEHPIIRLWGNLGKRYPAEKSRFTKIGREIGKACVRNGLAIACTDLQPETLEYWALEGIRDAKVPGAALTPVYLHFNVTEGFANGASRVTMLEFEASAKLVEIPYPPADSQRLAKLPPDIARERVKAHDARLGSLLQSSAVILVGGNDSPRHLVQLMNFIEFRHLRVADPLVFVPIPWIGGGGKEAYAHFRGQIDDKEFLDKFIPKQSP